MHDSPRLDAPALYTACNCGELADAGIRVLCRRGHAQRTRPGLVPPCDLGVLAADNKAAFSVFTGVRRIWDGVLSTAHRSQALAIRCLAVRDIFDAQHGSAPAWIDDLGTSDGTTSASGA